MSLPPATPSVGLKSRVLAAATGEKAPRPAILTRVFWAAAAVVLFSIVIGSLTSYHSTRVTKDGVQGHVRWKDRSVKLRITGLPKLPEGKVYQLWQVGASPAPIPGAIFTLDPAGRLVGSDTFTVAIVKGHAFAITMEPAGGSKSPTMPLHFVAPVN